MKGLKRLRSLTAILLSVLTVASVVVIPAGAETVNYNRSGIAEVFRDVVIGDTANTAISAAISKDNSLYTWGYGTTTLTSAPTKIMDNVVSYKFYGFHYAVITDDGSLYTWGFNEFGQLGDGTNIDRDTPKKVLDNVVSVSLSNHHSAAITNDGSLYIWGRNNNSQVGDGTTDHRYIPTKVMDNVVSFSLSLYNCAAVTDDGSLYTWGDNYHGQIGDGTTKDRYIPTKIMDNVVSVNCTENYSAAITNDGSLYTWGYNFNGQLGDGTTNDRYTPTKILDNVVSVSIKDCAAITTDRSLYTWGYNYYGQVGDGTTRNRYTPTKVLENVVSFEASPYSYSRAAITKDGSLYTWGGNGSGQLGDGTTDDRYTPTKNKVLDNVVSVSMGSRYSAAVTADGSLYTWGENQYGQLGDGTKSNKYLPKKITVESETDLSSNNYFVIGVHNNSFPHDPEYFFNKGEKRTYAISESYYALLLNQVSSTNSKKNKIQDNVDEGWHGSCLGLSVSMVQAHQNQLNDLISGTDITDGNGFYNLLAPKYTIDSINNNPGQENLRNIINYNQLLYDNVIEPDNIVYKIDVFSKLQGKTKKAFLSNLVNEAKECSKDNKPFILGYTYSKGLLKCSGHAVIVCGYNYEKNEENIDVHKLTIYDPNTVWKEQPEGKYLTLEISSDFSDFSFIDANFVDLNERWCSLTYYKDSLYVNKSKMSLEPSNSEFVNSKENNLTKTEISVSAFMKFKISNDSGDYLIYDGENYSGTMNIYSSYPSGEENVRLNFLTDQSSYFKVEELESETDEFEITAEVNGQYYKVKQCGADSILLSNFDGIVIEADSDYSFTTAIGSSLKSCELVKAQGTANDNLRMYSDDNGINFISDGTINDLTVTTFLDTETNESEVYDDVSQISVTDDSNGDTEIIAFDSGSDKTFGNFSYELLDDGTVKITKYNGNEAVVEIPANIEGKKVTTIGEYAFKGCSSITNVTIPDTVTSLEYGAFYECTGLTSVDIPDSITSMGEKVFAWCSNLKSISIPDFVASDDYYKLRVRENGTTYYKPMSMIPFYFTHNIRHITVKDGATAIGDYALYEFTDLESITIPDSVTSIGKYSFSGCTGLKNITIPASVTSIGEEAFLNCAELTLYGTKGSYVETYAKENNIPFVTIDSEPEPEPEPKPEPEPDPEPLGILGDVNNDGSVDSFDALLILRYAVGLEEFDKTQNKLADVNYDSSVDSLDSLTILRFSVGLIDYDSIGKPLYNNV